MLIVILNKPWVPRPLRVKIQQPSSLTRSGGDAKVEAGCAEKGNFPVRGRGLLFNVGGEHGNGMSRVPVLVKLGVLGL